MKIINTAFLGLALSSVALYTGCDKGDKKEEGDKDKDKDKDGDKGKDGDKAGDGDKKGDAKSAKGVGEAPKFEALTDAALELSDLKVKVDKSFAGGKYVKLDFKAKRIKDPGEHPNVNIKAACQVGDEVTVDIGGVFGQFEKMEDGESKQVDSSMFMSPALQADPTMCEFTVFFDQLMSMDSEPKIMKEMCWTGGETMAEGKCADLKRQDTSELVKVVKAEGKLEEITYGDNKGKKDLRTNYTVLVGGVVPKDKSIGIKTACMVGSDKIVDNTPSLAQLRYMGPGESMMLSSSSYPGKGVDSDPSQCDLTFQLKNLFEDKGDVVGEFCFKDGAMSEGKCG